MEWVLGGRLATEMSLWSVWMYLYGYAEPDAGLPHCVRAPVRLWAVSGPSVARPANVGPSVAQLLLACSLAYHFVFRYSAFHFISVMIHMKFAMRVVLFNRLGSPGLGLDHRLCIFNISKIANVM